MTKLLPFDLEAAKAGAKVLYSSLVTTHTKDDAFVPVWFIGVSKHGVAVIEHGEGGVTTALDCFLRLAPTPVKRWRVIYRGADDNAAQRDFEQYADASNFWRENEFSEKPFTVEVTP